MTAEEICWKYPLLAPSLTEHVGGAPGKRFTEQRLDARGGVEQLFRTTFGNSGYWECAIFNAEGEEIAHAGMQEGPNEDSFYVSFDHGEESIEEAAYLLFYSAVDRSNAPLFIVLDR